MRYYYPLLIILIVLLHAAKATEVGNPFPLVSMLIDLMLFVCYVLVCVPIIGAISYVVGRMNLPTVALGDILKRLSRLYYKMLAKMREKYRYYMTLIYRWIAAVEKRFNELSDRMHARVQFVGNVIHGIIFFIPNMIKICRKKWRKIRGLEVEDELEAARQKTAGA